MRPVLAIVVATMILGGVYLFLEQKRSGATKPVDLKTKAAEGKFSVDVLLTFEAGPDPFAKAENARSLTVQFQGTPIFAGSDPIGNGQVITIDDVPEVLEGPNEFYVVAVPTVSNPDLVHALRLRVLRDGDVVGSKWIASEPGAPVEGAVIVDVEVHHVEEHSHD